VREWKEVKPKRSSRFFFGFGYGADANGFAHQPGPPPADKPRVTYPFKSFDGQMTIDKERSGERIWDYNKDGIAHYGLHPDWWEDLRIVGGPEIMRDMARGSEAYTQMWERTVGVPGPGCRSARGRFTSNGVWRVFLGDNPEQLLRRAGQPGTRTGRVWQWCVQGKRNEGTELVAAFSKGGRVALVGSTARGHRTQTIERGELPPASAKPFGKDVVVTKAPKGSTFVFGLDKGRVAYLAVASRSAAKTPAQLRTYLSLAGLN
jgi:hypothetical protein